MHFCSWFVFKKVLSLLLSKYYFKKAFENGVPTFGFLPSVYKVFQPIKVAFDLIRTPPTHTRLNLLPSCLCLFPSLCVCTYCENKSTKMIFLYTVVKSCTGKYKIRDVVNSHWKIGLGSCASHNHIEISKLLLFCVCLCFWSLSVNPLLLFLLLGPILRLPHLLFMWPIRWWMHMCPCHWRAKLKFYYPSPRCAHIKAIHLREI